MRDKKYVQTGGVDEGADEGDGNDEEDTLHIDRIVPFVVDSVAQDALLLGLPVE